MQVAVLYQLFVAEGRRWASVLASSPWAPRSLAARKATLRVASGVFGLDESFVGRKPQGVLSDGACPASAPRMPCLRRQQLWLGRALVALSCFWSTPAVHVMPMRARQRCLSVWGLRVGWGKRGAMLMRGGSRVVRRSSGPRSHVHEHMWWGRFQRREETACSDART